MKVQFKELAFTWQDIALGIVTPMANEIDNAENFVSAVFEVCDRYQFKRIELYAVFDKACTDGTFEALQAMASREPRLKLVWAPDNRCVVDAYVRGYKEAILGENDWILEIDAGFSHDPGQIPLFFSKMAKGWDCVFGVRFGLKEAKFEGNLKRWLISWGGTKLTNALLGTRLGDMTSGFELFSSDALKYILSKGIHSKGPFFQTEIKVHAHEMNITQVPIHYRSPTHQIRTASIREAFQGLWQLYKTRKKNILSKGRE